MRIFSVIALGLVLTASLAACFGDEDLGGPGSGSAGAPSAGASNGNEAGDGGAPESDAPALCRAFCGVRSRDCDERDERALCEADCARAFSAHPTCAWLTNAYFYCRALHGCADATACARQLEQSEQCYSPTMTP